MNKKVKTALSFSFIILLGLVILFLVDLSLNFFAHIKGYIELEQCSTSIRLPYETMFISIEIIIGIMLSCFFVYTEIYAIKTRLLKSAVFIALLNVIFMTIRVIKYPLLEKTSSTWGDSKTDISVMTHPLFYVSITIVSVAIFIIYRNRKVFNINSLDKFSYIILLILLLSQGLAILTTTYKPCW